MKTKTSEQGSAMGMPGINAGRPIGAGSLLELAVEAPDKVYVIENRKGASLRPAPPPWPRGLRGRGTELLSLSAA